LLNGAIYERHGASQSLALRQQRAGYRSPHARNATEAKPCCARWEYYTQNRIWHPDGDLNLEGMKYNLRIYAEQTGAKGPSDYAKYIDQSYLYDALKELKKK
ncbi:MAG TPA: hypothetical protein VEO92_00320, partial [Candidatus Nitrosocosmicus sp.]|nr:hypothetical protein [Candidatus Nitrosocosmicus sp.]